jgi:hypothetical protein
MPPIQRLSPHPPFASPPSSDDEIPSEHDDAQQASSTPTIVAIVTCASLAAVGAVAFGARAFLRSRQDIGATSGVNLNIGSHHPPAPPQVSMRRKSSLKTPKTARRTAQADELQSCTSTPGWV